MAIAGYTPSFNPRKWSVQVYLDDRPAVTDEFEIQYLRPPLVGGSVSYAFDHSNTAGLSANGTRSYVYEWVGLDDLLVTETIIGNVTWPSWASAGHRVIYYYPAEEYACTRIKYYDSIFSCSYPQPLISDRKSSAFNFTYSYNVHAGYCSPQPAATDIVEIMAVASASERASALYVHASCKGSLISGGPFTGFVTPSFPSETPLHLTCLSSWCMPRYAYDTMMKISDRGYSVMVFSNITRGTFPPTLRAYGKTWSSECYYYFQKNTGVKIAVDQDFSYDDREVEAYKEHVTSVSLQIASQTHTVSQTQTIEDTSQSSSTTRTATSVTIQTLTAAPRASFPSSFAVMGLGIVMGIIALTIVVRFARRSGPSRTSYKNHVNNANNKNHCP